jgi:hypothetical protein
MTDETTSPAESSGRFEPTLADVWDDATNAVCQAMQEASMCLCPDGACVAAGVTFPASIYRVRR